MLLVVATISVKAQDQSVTKPVNEAEAPMWRAITVGNRVGLGDWIFTQPSINTFYQFNKNLAITSWIGGQVRNEGDNWYSGDILVNKLWRQGGTRLGAGFQYGYAQPVTQVSSIDNQQVFFIVEFSYRFKLK